MNIIKVYYNYNYIKATSDYIEYVSSTWIDNTSQSWFGLVVPLFLCEVLTSLM